MSRYRKLGRPSAHRKLMLRNLVLSLLTNGRIETTETRAKEARKFVDKMITLAKRGDEHSRRQVMAFLGHKEATKKLFEEIAPGYEERHGGYTRILKLGPRRGDGAPMVFIELV